VARARARILFSKQMSGVVFDDDAAIRRLSFRDNASVATSASAQTSAVDGDLVNVHLAPKFETLVDAPRDAPHATTTTAVDVRDAGEGSPQLCDEDANRAQSAQRSAPPPEATETHGYTIDINAIMQPESSWTAGFTTAKSSLKHPRQSLPTDAGHYSGKRHRAAHLPTDDASSDAAVETPSRDSDRESKRQKRPAADNETHVRLVECFVSGTHACRSMASTLQLVYFRQQHRHQICEPRAHRKTYAQWIDSIA
jgi:hypothetical protein